MSDNTVLMPPAVKTNLMAQVPHDVYTCRVKSAERHKSADPAKAGNESIHCSCEIVAPDVKLDTTTGQMVRAAGRTFDFYVPIVPDMRNYDNAFDYLGKLQMLEPNGGFIVDKVVAQLKKGDVFFDALILSSPSFHQYKDANGKYVAYTGPDGKPLQKGYQINMLNCEQMQCRVAPPAGFVVPQY